MSTPRDIENIKKILQKYVATENQDKLDSIVEEVMEVAVTLAESQLLLNSSEQLLKDMCDEQKETNNLLRKIYNHE
jgi:hypothetical protein